MPKSQNTKKILIVEDDALLSQVLRQSFLEKGLNVLVVGNGLEVVETAKEFMPDIILLDLVLPGLDGFAVLKNLKSTKITRKIPVVVLSNLDAYADVKSTQILGAEGHFIKAGTELKKIVETVVSLLFKKK